MDSPITRAEHEEFRRRLEAEGKRQDKRIELLEQNTKQISSLTISVEKLAQSIEMTVKEQVKHGERLEVLENRDGEMWRKAIGYIVTAVIGMAMGYFSEKVGLSAPLFIYLLKNPSLLLSSHRAPEFHQYSLHSSILRHPHHILPTQGRP